MHNNQQILLQTQPSVLTLVGDVDNQRVRITRSGSKMTAYIKSFNIRIEATWYGSYMNYYIYVPGFICERAYGHLGSCDGDPNNDVAIAGANDCEFIV